MVSKIPSPSIGSSTWYECTNNIQIESSRKQDGRTESQFHTARSHVRRLSTRRHLLLNYNQPNMRTSIALVASSFATASAFAPTSTQPLCVSSSALSATRRETFSTFSTATASILLSGVVQSPAQAAANEDEFNELINVLKARSDDNKEANTNYAMRADKMSSRVMKDAKTRRPKLM